MQTTGCGVPLLISLAPSREPAESLYDNVPKMKQHANWSHILGKLVIKYHLGPWVCKCFFPARARAHFNPSSQHGSAEEAMPGPVAGDYSQRHY